MKSWQVNTISITLMILSLLMIVLFGAISVPFGITITISIQAIWLYLVITRKIIG